MNQDEKKEQQAEYIVKMENIQLAFDIAKIPAPSEEQEKVMFETLEKLSRPYDEAAIRRQAQEEERERILRKMENQSMITESMFPPGTKVVLWEYVEQELRNKEKKE